MNIISNSCVGGFITRDYLKQSFNNPFVWCNVDNKSFLNLIKNYNTIDWLNYELVKDENWNFSIIVDKLVKINYTHYRFDKNADKLVFLMMITKIVMFIIIKYGNILLKNMKLELLEC